MINLLGIFLQAGGGSQYMQIIFFIGLFVVMYFFMIRPQQKKQKELKNFRKNLSKGQLVVTAGGIYGKILSIDGEKVVVDVDRGTKLTLDRNSISASGEGSEQK